MVLEPICCPDCDRSDVVKHGRSAAGKQRYCCRNGIVVATVPVRVGR